MKTTASSNRFNNCKVLGHELPFELVNLIRGHGAAMQLQNGWRKHPILKEGDGVCYAGRRWTVLSVIHAEHKNAYQIERKMTRHTHTRWVYKRRDLSLDSIG